MNIYYHPLYTYGIDSNSTFPRERYELIRNSLEAESNNGLINFVEPIKADLRDIYRAHSKDYVDRFLNSNLSDKEIREIGLKPWSSAIVDRTMFLTGGSLKALEDINNGLPISSNLGGGTHHAHRDKGSGFCIFNDLAICALKAINHYNFKKVLIIDLDVHQGDGTASILSGIDEIFTFSMHCQKNYPFLKQKSDLDVPLDEGMMDGYYIEILKKSLYKLDFIDSDIIFFQAGVDTLREDRYGKLNLSLDGLKLRNELIYKFSKRRKNPVIIFMGGGYSKPINKTVMAFNELFTFFSKYEI
tara:strand:- start:56 stop:958 length:903 start_codon:yes stop_codon:yes gene_type:complete